MTVIGFPTYFFKSAFSEPQRLSKIILYNRVAFCIQIRLIPKLCVGGGGVGRGLVEGVCVGRGMGIAESAILMGKTFLCA